METVDKLSSAAGEAAERIAGAANQAAETIGEKSEELMAMEERFMKKCRACVRDYPIASIGIALMAGFILSQMSSIGEQRRH